jgi:hypothetical protein
MFERIIAGGAPSSKTTEAATVWFLRNWPPGLRWPEDVPDLRPPRLPQPVNELVDA